MVYKFDFFVVEPAGNRFLLGTTKHRSQNEGFGGRLWEVDDARCPLS